MRLFGILLAQLGAIIAIAAYAFMETGTTVTLPGASVLGLPQTSEVANLALLFDRALVFGGGCALFLGGMILAAAGTIAGAATAAVPAERPTLTPEDQARWARINRLIVGVLLAGAVGLVLLTMIQPGDPRSTALENRGDYVLDLNSAEMLDTDLNASQVIGGTPDDRAGR